MLANPIKLSVRYGNKAVKQTKDQAVRYDGCELINLFFTSYHY